MKFNLFKKIVKLIIFVWNYPHKGSYSNDDYSLDVRGRFYRRILLLLISMLLLQFLFNAILENCYFKYKYLGLIKNIFIVFVWPLIYVGVWMLTTKE